MLTELHHLTCECIRCAYNRYQRLAQDTPCECTRCTRQAETAAPDREAVEATCSDLCCGTCQYCVSYDRWYQAGMPRPTAA